MFANERAMVLRFSFGSGDHISGVSRCVLQYLVVNVVVTAMMVVVAVVMLAAEALIRWQ